MNNVLKWSLLTMVIAITASACANKDAEKRIAQLESKIADLENNKSSQSPVANQQNTTITKAPEKPSGPLPVFAFETMDHDFGKIKEGDVVEHVFKFKNTGDAPMIIQNAQGSCGCTVPTWSKEPIAIGGEGKITAKFDSKNKPGMQNKTITVTANTWPTQTILRIRANVALKEGGNKSTADGPYKK